MTDEPRFEHPPEEAATSYLADGYSLRSWFLTTDHKRIALLYLVSITFFFLVGAGAAALISVLLPLFAFEGSPVADAAANRDFAAVKTLIAQKADVNAAQADGSTALHWAVYWNNAEAVDLLLKAGADTKAATRLNATPLYVAAENGNAVMIQKLLAAGANPNQKSSTVCACAWTCRRTSGR